MSSQTTIEVRDHPDESRFVVLVDGQPAGYSAYLLSGSTLTFLHTEVDDAFEGQGVGSALVRQSLDQLREREGLRVTASCPFVRAWIRKHPEYQDLTRR
jgi:predicted GNAT family acetyltransferase